MLKTLALFIEMCYTKRWIIGDCYIFIQHNRYYVVFFETMLSSQNQPHTVHFSLIFHTAAHGINTRRVDAGMSQNIGQSNDILPHPVKDAGKQMPQVMRKHLGHSDMRGRAKRFHRAPNSGTVDRIAVPCHKYHTGAKTAFHNITQQFLS